ncbi:MAG TPA: PilZ domain-containing protein [Pyrinomonadaceae bacterium]|nr:PilZ domain-containing protein [Pyrinomonadaceae bacterium]
MSERRSGKRWDVSLDAVWDGKSGNHTARISDLSEGGCYMDTMGDAIPGEILTLKLQLPTGEWLELTGEVAHHTPPLGFGLRFVDLPEEQVERLRSFIEYLKDPSSEGLLKQES